MRKGRFWLVDPQPTRAASYEAEQLIGRTFGRLTVTECLGIIRGHTRLVCRCICGNVTRCFLENLTSGNTKSCGCLHREIAGARLRTHGKSKTREHTRWYSAFTRCFHPGVTGYADYGGRGITMCKRWAESFEMFLQDMGPCPDGASLERIDCNGNYEPGNCRWATATEQANNTRKNVFITFDGRTQSIAQWARELGVPPGRIWYRVSVGLPPQQILSKDLLRGGVMAGKLKGRKYAAARYIS